MEIPNPRLGSHLPRRKDETIGTGVMSGRERQRDEGHRRSPRRQLQLEAGRTGRPLEARSMKKTRELGVPGASGSGPFWKGRAVTGSKAAELQGDSRPEDKASAPASVRSLVTLREQFSRSGRGK